MTRGEVARLLNVSVASIRRLEGKELFPKIDKRRVRRFDRSEVAEYARRRSIKTSAESILANRGSLEAKAMDLFVAGKSPLDVVRKLRTSCEEANRLWDFYQRYAMKPGRAHKHATPSEASEDDDIDEMAKEFRRRFEDTNGEG